MFPREIDKATAYMYLFSLSSCNLNIPSFFLTNLIFFVSFFLVGRRELHKLREGHQLAVVRRVRRHQAKCQQLGVDAFH